jgi:hypothetical protein
MIKLFNKIRKQMLDENRTGRYLKYAIGEIVLVMIGILLALQVNTWSKNKELKKEELKILKGLHQEFSENLMRFDTIYKLQEAKRNAVITVMTDDIEAYSIEKWDSIHNRVGQLWTFDPLQGFYNSVINSGKLDLISNDSLKTQISKFQDLVGDYKEEEQNTAKFSQEQIFPAVIHNSIAGFQIKTGMRTRTEEEKLLHKEGYLKLYRSNTIENMLTFLTAYMVAIFEEGPILREEMISIINLLELEIEKQN